ncbi:reverse transcriptase domain-containing protein [Bhargavaea ullalensis]|uniref:Reverse transcriptase domain-containing protein n=1 Tax=Bhargavaea ullalensis TaxID=1265685 RepID=A0ABV2GCS3_9BACL
MELKDIERHILSLAERKATEYHKYHNAIEILNQRDKRRISPPPMKKIYVPKEWNVDKKYNPFFVIKHHKKIAKSIFHKLINGTYKPFPPYKKTISKKDKRKSRDIYIFQIPDEAISHYFYERLLSKNKHRFSSFSYAYRNDRNVHYAIQDIALDLKDNPRLFVAEFDFKDFFGSISKEYLTSQFNSNGFLISDFEKKIISSFLYHFEQGIPQGTSISLFLANLACWSLDKKLESEGLRFARYADDTVIWSNDYNKICKSFVFIEQFSKEAGIKINYSKSEGISLLSKSGLPAEISVNKEAIEFLGYKLSSDSIGIKPQSVAKIKKNISYILYKNMIQPLKKPTLVSLTIPNNDKDPAFLSSVMQIRRYLYGNLNEQMLQNYLNGSYKRLNFKGLMSFYPLLDDEEQMIELDRWLVSTVLQVIKKRKELLDKRGYSYSTKQFPFTLDSGSIIGQCRTKRVDGKKGLYAIPSFARIFRAIQEKVITEGIEKTMDPKSNWYDY